MVGERGYGKFQLLPLIAAGGIAVMLAAAFLLLVWIVEDLAQGIGGADAEGCA